MAYRITLSVFLLLFSRVLFAEVITFPKIDDAVFTRLSQDETPLLTRDKLKEVSDANLHTASGISSYIQLVTGEKVKAPYLVIAFTKQDYIDNIASLDKWLLQNIDKSNRARMVSQRQKDPVRIMISNIVMTGKQGSCDALPITETLYVGDVHKFDVSCELNRKRDNVLHSSFVLSYASNYSFRTIGRQLPSIDIFASEPSAFSHTFETDISTKVKITYKPL
ncbi:hypothetical protein HGG82_04440 [Marinomonas sp. M1K-6]|uniref:Uncharacterized protein n=1 Tax=Marinomonas profundi TaxID=2726122 RepID=A0A847QVE3_9GAMM|nr:hypothetical protein [Marinomonas profundi]NLQ16868.1 hypothetical protein [Marinomonas profundi]UDV02600.1 hypothetical protein J8N69_13530 [Marinomonas profundi]